MNHPLSGNVGELSDADLQKKVSDLQKRLAQTWSMGMGEDVIRQIEMLLDDLREEQRSRDRKRTESMEEKNKGEDWDNLIDV